MQVQERLDDIVAELRTARRSLSADEIAEYHREGFLLIKELVSPEVAARLHDEVMEIMEAVGMGTTKLRQTWQYIKGSALDAFIKSQLQQEVASQLLGGRAVLYLPFTAVKSANGGGKFHFHQDNNYTRHFGHSINLWTALVPMRPENGCLLIEPRSHLSGDLESVNAGDGDAHRKVSVDPMEPVPILMEPGDCVAFTRLTVHGSGANTTDRHRVAYATQFHREDTEALIDGVRVRLTDHPRFTDIYGVDSLDNSAAGKRDGH